MDIDTLITDIEATDNVARHSPCPRNANITNGIPKNARLPNTVLIISRMSALKNVVFYKV
ncbi:MAG: hypothetical protein QXO23_07200 [Candidatus Methanomethyliaceae archaeon]